jgi:N-acylglucosamine 2-epimerase
MDLNTADDLAGLRSRLYSELMNSVIPFWMNHAIDDAGGINTCIRDDGSIVNRDKWLWSQWRAVWVWSKLHNTFGPNRSWWEVAERIYRFASRFGWDDAAKGWRLRLAHDGRVLDGCESIYVDGFAIYALTEFARAGGGDEAVALARKTADSVLERLRAPHDRVPAFPYPTPPGARIHGLPMIFSLVMWELGALCDEDIYRRAAINMTNDIFSHFYRADRDAILERISADNGEYPPPVGTAIVPGHGVEDMWFQIHIAREAGNARRIQEACRLIDRHLTLGWDNEFGGILLAVDADGRDEVGWEFADTKLWWPHTEALYATLLAYEHTRDKRFLDWYSRVHEYSFSHFPVAGYGEWTQKLDRRGQPITQVVALPVKDPFHLPRALMNCIEVLDRLTA